MGARIIICLLLLASAHAQDVPDAPSATQAAQLQSVTRVPGVNTVIRGLNFGITFAGVHESGIGWYTTLTPAASYTVSPHLTADISLTLYPTRNAPTSTAQLAPTHWDAGDTWLSAHYITTSHRFLNTTTAALSFPTGNSQDGLSTGRVSFDFSDHVERYHGNLGALLDFGIGDSAALFNNAVTQDYSGLGTQAHFQLGLIHWFPGRVYLQSSAYEQLPLGDQKIYATILVTPPSGRPHTEEVVTGRHVYEDNGFTTTLGIPLTEHITLSSYYNRSLRLHLDTVSTGITFVWKGTPIHRRQSLYDKAFVEGERLLNEADTTTLKKK